MFPHFKREKQLQKKGYKIVGGVDEAGRGALAGPVVAAVVLLKKNPKSKLKSADSFLKEIKDSKQLSPQKREKLYRLLTGSVNIEWGISRTSERIIDKINILEATKLTMARATRNLEKKTRRKVRFLILDGNFTLPAEALAKAGINSNIPQKPIKKADEKVLSCACASILAKVTRDRIMIKLDRKYFSRYKFSRHKGYGTKLHFKMLKKYGPCKIHRKSFHPIKKCKN